MSDSPQRLDSRTVCICFICNRYQPLPNPQPCNLVFMLFLYLVISEQSTTLTICTTFPDHSYRKPTPRYGSPLRTGIAHLAAPATTTTGGSLPLENAFQRFNKLGGSADCHAKLLRLGETKNYLRNTTIPHLLSNIANKTEVKQILNSFCFGSPSVLHTIVHQ